MMNKVRTIFSALCFCLLAAVAMPVAAQSAGYTKLNVKGRRDPKADIAVFECRENAGRIEAWIEPAP